MTHEIFDESRVDDDSVDGQNDVRFAHMRVGLIAAADVALMLQVAESWVQAEARAGRMPHVALGRYRRFEPDAIADWIAERERGFRATARVACPAVREEPALIPTNQDGNANRKVFNDST
jgi:hypothetical protein